MRCYTYTTVKPSFKCVCSACRSPMAYVFGFPHGVTNLIYSFRDWRLEDVKRKQGTPSRLALKPYKFMIVNFTKPDTYLIRLEVHFDTPDEEAWIFSCEEDEYFLRNTSDWDNVYNKENYTLERRHGPLVYPCLSPIMHDNAAVFTEFHKSVRQSMAM